MYYELRNLKFKEYPLHVRGSEYMVFWVDLRDNDKTNEAR